MENKSTLYKVFNFPLMKILIGLIVCGGAVTLAQIGGMNLLASSHMVQDSKNAIIGFIVSVVAITSYIVLFKFYERRKISEFSLSTLPKNFFLGSIIGIGLQALVILVIAAYHDYIIVSVNPWLYLIPSIAFGITTAFTEEIIFRGIIYRITEEKLGSWIAVIISALLFGAAHLGNAHSSLYSGLAIALEAGVLLSAAYIYSKTLWLPIFIHFGWNFAESGIFGAPDSGHTMTSTFLVAKFQGNEWITGGAFGPENSLQATLFCTIAGCIFLWLAVKQKKIIPPFWKKGQKSI